MNELIQKIILISKIKTIGWFRWRKILAEHGVNKPSALSQKQLEEIILNIFKISFKESKKDKKIKLDKLGKTYENGFKAVHDFSLDVDSGDFVCLLGPSGCGKTTALRMIAGLDYITEGTYTLGNKEMNSIHPSERQTAMVFQNYALYPFMTVYNNIAFGLKLKTTKNDLVVQNIKKLMLSKHPNFDLIKDAKFRIWELKHPFNHEINATKVKLKKASFKEFNKDEYKLLEKELNAYKDEKNKLKGSRLNELIAKEKATITRLKNEEKQLIAERKIKLQNEKKEILEQINALTKEQEEYKNKKQGEIPVIEANIVRLKNEKSELTKEYNKQLKHYSKFAKKRNKNNEEYSVVKSRIENIEHEFELKEKEILFEKNKIFAINESKVVDIQKLKTRLNGAKLIKKQILNAAVIWKYSIPARVHELSSLVGIRNFLKRKPSALSGGQRQRVALIRAISKDAQLFLFDEPLSNLDAKLRGVMRSEIKKIHERIGATSLYVTHDQIEAMTMANKVVIMNVGYIQQVGAPKDLYDNPSNVFVARFIGTPTINMVKGQMKTNTIFASGDTNIKLKFSAEQKAALNAYKDKDVILGIRPHHIEIDLENKKSVNSMDGVIEATELVGSEYVLRVQTKDLKVLRVLVEATKNVAKGQKVQIKFENDKTFIFDSVTGTSITSKLNDATKAALKVWNNSVGERIGNKSILESERNGITNSQKISREIRAKFDKKYRVSLIHQKVEKNNQKVEDYSLVEIDEEDSVQS